MTTVADKQLQTPRRPEPGTSLPVIAGAESFGTLTEQITSVVLTRPTPPFWYYTFAVGMAALIMFVVSVIYLLYRGVGVFGIEIPVAWSFAITNFVWWIGIGHAGTLISAILLLLNQGWRNSINRFAEAMTIFAVMCAGLFPLLHLGRPWLCRISLACATAPRTALPMAFTECSAWDGAGLRGTGDITKRRRCCWRDWPLLLFFRCTP
jgi:hypothetical protein